MKFRKEQPIKVVIIGAGGTGGYIAPHLYRLLRTLGRKVRVILCDGDIVEEKNLVRQNFIEADLGENKAQVMAERYSSAFGLETDYISRFIESSEELARLVQPEKFIVGPPIRSEVTGEYEVNEQPEPVILIGAVDNNKSRKMCHEVFTKEKDLIYIDSGNGEFSGQVVGGVRRRGRTVLKPVAAIYPEILDETDKFPSELSCAEAAVSAPQAIVANLVAATTVVCLVYNIVVLGSNSVHQAAFSTKNIHVRPTVVQRQRRAA